MANDDKKRADLATRCAGAILGTAFGDALGAGVEGWPPGKIRLEHGEVRDFLAARLGAGYYTDDTQMTLAMARSLLRCGRIDGADCARSCAEMFDPDRGYGRSALDILAALGKGANYAETGSMLFPEGSFGNGAAMRIAPVGLLCGEMDLSLMRAWVYESVRATHIHEEAIDGALVIAAAVGALSRRTGASRVDGPAFLLELSPYCRTMEMRSRIILAARLLEEDAQPDEVVELLGNGVRTLESVPTALFTAMRFSDDPERALVAAVGYGGDADTIAAMTGAVVGALNGAESFPQRWHDGLERGPDGYDALLDVSRQLSKMISRGLPH